MAKNSACSSPRPRKITSQQWLCHQQTASLPTRAKGRRAPVRYGILCWFSHARTQDDAHQAQATLRFSLTGGVPMRLQSRGAMRIEDGHKNVDPSRDTENNGAAPRAFAR